MEYAHPVVSRLVGFHDYLRWTGDVYLVVVFVDRTGYERGERLPEGRHGGLLRRIVGFKPVGSSGCDGYGHGVRIVHIMVVGAVPAHHHVVGARFVHIAFKEHVLSRSA